MALTFGKFAVGFMELPATIFSGLLNITFGHTQTDDQGNIQLDKEKQPIVRDGFVSFALDVIKELGRDIADLAASNKRAIAIAFWFSLTVAGGLALTLFLWPAALTAVANFSIFGFSIAGLVGTNSLLQIGVAAGLAAAATSVATYFTDAVVNAITALVNACSGAPKTSDSSDDFDNSNDYSEQAKLVRNQLNPTSVDNVLADVAAPLTPPAHNKSPILAAQKDLKTENENLATDLTALAS